jgi:hypothetical protein
MKILFDQGTPAPLRQALSSHEVSTAHEMGWSNLSNGDLLSAAEAQFDLFITTDRNLSHQQNLSSRQLSILVLPTTSWPKLQLHTNLIAEAAASMRKAEYRELQLE